MSSNLPVPSLKDADLKGAVVLLRLDCNVSIQNGKIENDYRLRRSLPTIEYIKKRGGKVVILSHIESEGVGTLSEIYKYYKNLFPLTFVTDPIAQLKKERFSSMQEGEVVLLENLRNYSGEKKNDPHFADVLASLGDVYVNDAFSVSHRSHASVVGIPKRIRGFAGFVLEDEIIHLSKAFSPKKPFLFILGGAKFDTKLPLVQKFLKIADTVYICGALANDCFKAQGLNVGGSVASEEEYDLGYILQNKKIILPKDVVVETRGEISVKYPEEVVSEDVIYDAGPEALEEIRNLAHDAKFILWNGPLGLYEKGFKESTIQVAKIITESDAESVVGGGDTLSAIDELAIEDKFSFVSTGGGAMLEFLADETLPGIEALRNSRGGR